MTKHINELHEEYERFTDLAKEHLSFMDEIEGAIDSDLKIQDVFKNINGHLLKTEKYMKKALRNLGTEFISDEDQ